MGEHQYGMPDLRNLVAGRRTHFQETSEATGEPPFFLQTRNVLAIPQQTHYDSSMVGHEAMLRSTGFVKLGHDHYCSSNATTLPGTSNIASSSGGAATLCGVEMEREWAVSVGGNNNSRWPRQETLTLLEIRSRLDSRFKEANQKGPLWDEVSRIMAEEHGYQRSGKKCREKFENLYKYYRKTKEGKAGRQDGKHYRFFRQLEALYGDTSNQTSAAAETTRLASNIPLFQNPTSSATNQEYAEAFQENKHSCESISFSNTSEFETSSSENNDDDLSAIAYMMNRSTEKHKKGNESYCHGSANNKKSWKTKVKEFVDLEMRKVMEAQQAWMEKMLRTIEDREQARISREQEWTKQEMARFDREHEFWAKEREWIRARDASLMEALKKYAGKGQELTTTIEQIALVTQCHYENQHIISGKKVQNNVFTSNMWTEPEILSLLQIRNAMEPRFQQSGYSKGGLWEEIAEKMASSGYDRSGDDCKEKWESLRRRNYLQQLESHHDNQDIAKQEANCMSSPSTSFVGSQVHGDRFQRPVNDGSGEHLWYKYGLSSS